MQTVNIEIPDAVWESHQHNKQAVQTEVQQAFIIWEYLNGHLSLRESSELLHISYRHFLDLLWSKGIPIDGLNNNELRTQAEALEQQLNLP